MIQLPRSTFYYRAQTQAPHLNDEELMERIEAIQDELSGAGLTHHPCSASARLWCQPQADSSNHETVWFGNQT